MAVVPLSLGGPSNGGGHECTLGDEFPQTLKRDVLHVEGLSYGTKANVPQIESVLTLEHFPWDGALVCQQQKNAVKVPDPTHAGTPCSLARWGCCGELAMEASRGSPSWQSFFQVDVGEQEPEMLECIDPHWRATHWLQVAIQGITEEEVPWYELVTPLMLGTEGMALSLAKHLFVVWWWNIKVCREDNCPLAPTVLNIGQFMTDEETAGGVGEPHWFMAYSHALQWVGKAAHRWKWEWPTREALKVKASPLVCAFWHETGMDLTVASIKLCWEPTPRVLYHQRESSPTTQVITFLDELAVHIPGLSAWDQLVWPPAAAIPWALTEAELYGYCRGQAVDLSPMMPAAQLWVMEEGGAYLCIARALVFEGIVLAYNPTMNKAESVPVHSLANDLTWAEERSAMALVSYVPCVPAEAAQIARLGAHRIVSCPDDSSILEEEEAWHPSHRPWTLSPSGRRRVKTGLDRPTWRKKQSQTDGSAHGTGRESWRGWRDWHMMTRGQTPMLLSGGRWSAGACIILA